MSFFKNMGVGTAAEKGVVKDWVLTHTNLLYYMFEVTDDLEVYVNGNQTRLDIIDFDGEELPYKFISKVLLTFNVYGGKNLTSTKNFPDNIQELNISDCKIKHLESSAPILCVNKMPQLESIIYNRIGDEKSRFIFNVVQCRALKDIYFDNYQTHHPYSTFKVSNCENVGVCKQHNVYGIYGSFGLELLENYNNKNK